MPRITLVQMNVGKSNRASIRSATSFIASASEKSDLIVFPEQFIRGEFKAQDAKKLISEFSSLAKRHRIDIIPGSILVREGGRRYNTSYYIDRNGKILSSYRKNNPWRGENVHKGAKPRPFQTVFGRTSLIICWDLASPSVSQHLSRQDLDLVVCPSLWWAGTESGSKNRRFASDMIDALCTARAYEWRCTVAYVNAAGTINLERLKDASAGSTQVNMPFLGAVARAQGIKEQTVSFEVRRDASSSAKRYFG